MTDIPKIQDYFNPTSGIVSHIGYEFELATNEEIDTLMYVTFGERNVAPVVTKILSETPTNDELNLLGKLILVRYKNNWDKKKALCKLEYDPIHNYEDSFSESVKDNTINTGTESSNSTDNKTLSNTNSKTRTDNLTALGSTTDTASSTSSKNDNSYGFNSSSAVPTDTESNEEHSSDNATSSLSNTGTQKNEETGSGTDNSVKAGTLTKAYNVANDVTKSSKHIGNIGNLTTQQLMKQELELWKWSFVESVLADLKDFLTLSIYV